MDDLQPGQVRYASVRTPVLRPERDDIKPRPVILISQPDGDWWKVMGLTTLTRFTDGNPRVKFVDGPRLSLPGSFLWGTTTMIPPEDVMECHGCLSRAGVDQIIDEFPELSTVDVVGLWESLEGIT